MSHIYFMALKLEWIIKLHSIYKWQIVLQSEKKLNVSTVDPFRRFKIIIKVIEIQVELTYF